MDMDRARGKKLLQPDRVVIVQDRRKEGGGGGRVGDFLRIGINSRRRDIGGQHPRRRGPKSAALGRQQAFGDPVRIGLALKIRMPGRLEVDQTPGQQAIQPGDEDKQQGRAWI